MAIASNYGKVNVGIEFNGFRVIYYRSRTETSVVVTKVERAKGKTRNLAND